MDNIDRRLVLGAVGLAGMTALASRGRAGPLDPPAGPVGPTTKPLGEIEPRTAVSDTNTPGNASARYRITRPGSYYLLDNILNIGGRHGIEIASSDVTLDMCGFALTGQGGGNFDGITVLAGSLSGITVRNGSVRNWGRIGLSLSSFTSGSLVEAITCANTGSVGISTGNHSVVRYCRVNTTGSNGIVTGFHSTVEGCTASNATFAGISANSGTTITQCSAQGNGTLGISASGSVSHCVATANTGTGISVSQGSITNCTANGNSTGISGGVGTSIASCSAADNAQIGISINDGGSIIDCTAFNNAVNNLRCADGCLVRECNTFSNINGVTQASIRGTGNNNRLEGNNATGATVGFDIDGTGNVMRGNTAGNNTNNYSIAAGNVCLVIAAATAGAFNGNSGGVSPGTTSHWANLAI